jgi:hypothetical protein
MSPAITISVHVWRGIGSETQKDLFYYGLRLGFVTVSVERKSVLAAYKRLRSRVEELVIKLEGKK